MKIVFMGTPQFAVPILTMLHEHHEVVLVVTQPDKPVGRKRKLQASPVKQLAQSLNIPVFQPRRIRKDYQPILDQHADVLITAAYGQILPKGLLNGIRSINIHGSLLPAYRGASPIQYALFDGLKETGITIMEMVYEMDAGPIIAQAKQPIEASNNFETLSQKLSQLGCTLLNDVLNDFEAKFEARKPQNEALVTFSPLIKYEDERITFFWPTAKIVNRVRGLSPQPGAHFYYQNQQFKIFKAIKSDIIEHAKKPGTILCTKNVLTIQTADGAINILEIQAPGKKRLPIRDYLNGQTVFAVGNQIKEDDNV